MPAPPAPAPHRPDPARWRADRVTLAWLGHATLLIRLFDRFVLVDPVLFRKIGLGVGPFVVGPTRLVEPALTARELPPIDLLLLTHAHLDHTDRRSLRQLERAVPVVVQANNRDLVRRFRDVRELAWGEATTVHGIRVESVSGTHWGARMVVDRRRGYGGYLLSAERDGRTAHVLLGGDTALTDRLRPIGARVPIDVAVLGIGAYDPWIANHASPEQAWTMFEELGARHLVPVHHSTFVLSREPLHEPMQRLHAAAGAEHGRIVIREIGQTWTLPEPADGAAAGAGR